MSAVDEARQLVSDIEAVVVPTEHRYAGMVTTKLDEAKMWALKMVEELGASEQREPAAPAAPEAPVAPLTPEAPAQGADTATK